MAPGGRLLVVDFAPHRHDFLRDAQAHRRLGFDHDQVRHWLDVAGLHCSNIRDLAPPPGTDGLTVTVWLVFQFAVVNVSEAGETVPSVVSLDDNPRVTFAVGGAASRTVNVAVPPASVVTRPLVGAITKPATLSSSRFVTDTSGTAMFA